MAMLVTRRLQDFESIRSYPTEQQVGSNADTDEETIHTSTFISTSSPESFHSFALAHAALQCLSGI
jgi:hypothetical protein